MKAVVAAFNQEKALVGAFSVIVQPVVEPMDRFAALNITLYLYLLYCIFPYCIYQEGHCLTFAAISKVRVSIVWRLVNEENVAEK